MRLWARLCVTECVFGFSEDVRHVEGGALEGGLAEHEERGGGVGRPRVGVVPVAIPLHDGQVAVHLVHRHHGDLREEKWTTRQLTHERTCFRLVGSHNYSH